MSVYQLIARSDPFTIPAEVVDPAIFGVAQTFSFSTASVIEDGYFYAVNSNAPTSRDFTDNRTLVKSIRVETVNAPGLRLSWPEGQAAPILNIKREATGGLSQNISVNISAFNEDIPLSQEIGSPTKLEKFRFVLNNFEECLLDTRGVQAKFIGVESATLRFILTVECVNPPD